jgi:hypothetical protein
LNENPEALLENIDVSSTPAMTNDVELNKTDLSGGDD